MEGFTIKPQDFINNTLRTDELDKMKKAIKQPKFANKKVIPRSERSCKSCLYCREKVEGALISYYCAHMRSQKFRQLVGPGDSCPKFLGKDY